MLTWRRGTLVRCSMRGSHGRCSAVTTCSYIKHTRTVVLPTENHHRRQWRDSSLLHSFSSVQYYTRWLTGDRARCDCHCHLHPLFIREERQERERPRRRRHPCALQHSNNVTRIAGMGEVASPANKLRVAPPMPWRTRLAVLAAGYLTDATRRADGTVNRRLLSLLDKGVPASATPRNGVASRDLVLDPAVTLRARLFYPCPRPAGADTPVPVVVFFHGGGFVYLSVASPSYDAACRRIARYTGAAVLSVEYRRSPEHRFPAAYDDGFAALRFLDDPGNHPRGDAGVPPLDVSRCFLAGDSAGGNIAHHVARRYALAMQQHTRAFSAVRLAGLLAIQPFFGGEERTPAELRLDGAPIVSVARCDWMWRAFLPPGADRTHEAADAGASSPAAAAGIDSPYFPPATVVIGGYDPLQDWQRRYSEALRARGKEVRVIEYPDAIHAFYVFPEFADAKDLMLRIKDIVASPEEAPHHA